MGWKEMEKDGRRENCAFFGGDRKTDGVLSIRLLNRLPIQLCKRAYPCLSFLPQLKTRGESRYSSISRSSSCCPSSATIRRRGFRCPGRGWVRGRGHGNCCLCARVRESRTPLCWQDGILPEQEAGQALVGSYAVDFVVVLGPEAVYGGRSTCQRFDPDRNSRTGSWLLTAFSALGVGLVALGSLELLSRAVSEQLTNLFKFSPTGHQVDFGKVESTHIIANPVSEPEISLGEVVGGFHGLSLNLCTRQGDGHGCKRNNSSSCERECLHTEICSWVCFVVEASASAPLLFSSMPGDFETFVDRRFRGNDTGPPPKQLRIAKREVHTSCHRDCTGDGSTWNTGRNFMVGNDTAIAVSCPRGLMSRVPTNSPTYTSNKGDFSNWKSCLRHMRAISSPDGPDLRVGISVGSS